MKAREIKKLIKDRFNLEVKVKTGVSKRPYISAWMPFETKTPFPLEFRQKCLRVIYGENCEFAINGEAGNVAPHMILMHAEEWDKAFN
jgi:hypothetical protein